MRVALIGFSLFLLTLTASAADWAHVVKQIEKSIVYIETDGGACTGFVIDTTRKYVMSAAHCYNLDTETIWVDRVKGKVVSLDTKKDLMVLKVEDLDPARPALKLAARNPERAQEVMSAGFGYALESAQFRLAHIADDQMMIPEDGIGGPFFSTDATFVPGQSGGPVVNYQGEVVMIVQRGSNSVGIGVGAEVIRQRTGRFWADK